MKREVASSLVERGVAERVRLTQAYEKKKTELQKQHDTVKSQLNDHRDKVCGLSFCFRFSMRRKTKMRQICIYCNDFLLNLSNFMYVFVCLFVHRLGHYLKKIVNLGHAFHPKDF